MDKLTDTFNTVMSDTAAEVLGKSCSKKQSWITDEILALCDERRKLRKHMKAMEMRCYRRLLNISYTEHITNVEVRNRIERAIGPYEDLLTTVKRRKLKWYGHVSRSSGLSKTIMQGTVKGGRRRGGQRKRWEDNIKDWTCLRAAESLRVAKDRNGWREVVRRSVMAPLRPPEVMG